MTSITQNKISSHLSPFKQHHHYYSLSASYRPHSNFKNVYSLFSQEQQTMNNDDRFQEKSDKYNEFLVLYDRHPKINGKGHNEHELAVFKTEQRRIYHSTRGMLPHRQKMLDDVHPGILDHSLPYNHSKEPSVAWKEVFKNWASETTKDKVRAYKFPTITDSYVPTANSFKEHFIIKTGMHRHFEPNDCHPDKCILIIINYMKLNN